MLKKVKKIFDFQVNTSGETISKSFDLDKNIVIVNGLLVTSDKDDLLYLRGTQKIEINKVEHFPERYHSKLLMSGINVSPNDRYVKLGSVSAGNGNIKITYKDVADDRSTFLPYTVFLYVDCEMEDKV